MSIDIDVIKINGALKAYQATVRDSEVVLFTVVGKLTRSELSSSLAKKCINTPGEAYEALKQFTLQEASMIYKNGNVVNNPRIEIFYSPCWKISK